MNFKSRLILIAFILWLFISWYWYTCKIKGFCFFDFSQTNEQVEKTYDPPFTFNKSSFLSIKGKGFQDYIDSLKKIIAEGKILTITGWYDISEKNKSSYSNLGLARAMRIKQLMASSLDTSKINIQSKIFENGIPVEPFIAHTTDVKITDSASEDGLNETLPEVIDSILKETEKGKNIPNDPYNAIVISFDYNSSKPIISNEIEVNLEKMASELKNNKKQIKIIGYNLPNENIKIGRIRAWVIKSRFLEKGINTEQLITSSSEIDAQNKNGRVEIKY